MASVYISNIEVLALKKLAPINDALVKSLNDEIARREQAALTSVIVEFVSRASLINAAADGRAHSPAILYDAEGRN